MRVHACLLGIGLGLWLGFPGTAPAEPSGADPAAAAAPDPGRQLPWLRRFAHSLPRFHWGLGEWPLPALEAERNGFGFRLEFAFGRGDAPRRQPRVR